MSKEAIQAANYLTSLPMKDKLRRESIATYKSYLIPRQSGKSAGSARVSSPRLSSPPSLPSPSPPPVPPYPATVSADKERVVTLWTTRLRQHRAGQQMQQQLMMQGAGGVSQTGGGAVFSRPPIALGGGIPPSPPRPLSSPTAVAVSTAGGEFKI